MFKNPKIKKLKLFTPVINLPLQTIHIVGGTLIPDDIWLPSPDPEPFREDRFLVEFPSELGINPNYVRSVTMPASVIEDNFRRLTWEPVTIVFYNYTEYNMANTFHNLMIDNGPRPQRFNFNIAQLNAIGDVISRWHLRDCFITSVDFGYLDYASEDIQKLTVTIQPSYCSLIY